MLLACVLYGGTMAPGLLWGDSGEAQLHIVLDGWYVNGEIVRSHVLYYAVARLLWWIFPVGAPLAGNLTAALAGAFTIANAAWIISRLTRSFTARWCGVAVLLFAHTLWQLSTSAEVVTLTTALMTGELICVLKLMETRNLRWLALVAFLNGLGVSNHNFAMLMWPVYGVLALVFRSAWSGDRFKKVAVACSFLLLGMLPVLALCVDDYLQHGSLRGTVKSFLVGHYSHKVSNVGSLGGLLLRSAAMGVLNFPTPVVLLALPGAWRLLRGSSKATALLLLGGAVMFCGFGFRYNVPDQHTFLVPAFVFVAVLVAYGVDGLCRRLTKPWRFVLMALSCVGPLAYASGPPVLRRVDPNTSRLPTRHVPYRERFSWFLHPWRVGYDGAERYGRELLRSLPDNAVVGIDMTLAAPINYLQVAEGLRRDVLLDCGLARQDWFGPVDWQTIRQQALSDGRYFLGSDERGYWPKWIRCRGPEIEPAGHVFRVVAVASCHDGEADAANTGSE